MLLPEFFGGAHASRNFYFKPAAPGIDAGGSRRPQSALELVPLPHKRTLSNPGAPIQHLYFPQEGMVSLVQPLQGAMIEVGMIGNEGFVGVPVLLGADASPLETMVRFRVLRCGLKQVHFGRKRNGAPLSRAPCSATPRPSKFRSP